MSITSCSDGTRGLRRSRRLSSQLCPVPGRENGEGGDVGCTVGWHRHDLGKWQTVAGNGPLTGWPLSWSVEGTSPGSRRLDVGVGRQEAAQQSLRSRNRHSESGARLATTPRQTVADSRSARRRQPRRTCCSGTFLALRRQWESGARPFSHRLGPCRPSRAFARLHCD